MPPSLEAKFQKAIRATKATSTRRRKRRVKYGKRQIWKTVGGWNASPQLDVNFNPTMDDETGAVRMVHDVPEGRSYRYEYVWHNNDGTVHAGETFGPEYNLKERIR